MAVSLLSSRSQVKYHLLQAGRPDNHSPTPPHTTPPHQSLSIRTLLYPLQTSVHLLKVSPYLSMCVLPPFPQGARCKVQEARALCGSGLLSRPLARCPAHSRCSAHHCGNKVVALAPPPGAPVVREGKEDGGGCRPFLLLPSSAPLAPRRPPSRLGNVIPGCLPAQPFRCLLPRGPVSLDGFTWVLIPQQSPLA